MLVLRLRKEYVKKLQQGYPWVHRGQFIESSEQLLAAAGELAEIRSPRDEFLGIGTFNAKAPITCRLLTHSRETIDADFFRARFSEARKKRERMIDVPYYRLIHSEADGLPGLLIDRFGDIFVLQSGTTGMDLLLPHATQALNAEFNPSAILLRNDTQARAAEGAEQFVKIVQGTVPDMVEVHENGIRYLADLLRGQKTGWFYDQRENRALIASHAEGKTLLDVYSHSGGFGLLAAKAGAKAVTLVDSSAPALALAKQAAALNGVEVQLRQGEAFAMMEALAREGARYDIVVADPPAFVKSREHVASGLKGYEKVARGAAALVAEAGLLMVASCSHHADRARFLEAVRTGVKKAGREAEFLSLTGAAADHPRHPKLPQSEYLKAALFRLA